MNGQVGHLGRNNRSYDINSHTKVFSFSKLLYKVKILDVTALVDKV